MDQTAYDALIARLEKRARERPALYTASVAAVALLGFLILGVAIGFSFLLIGGFAGLVVLLTKFGGAGAAVLLAKLGKALFLLLIPAWLMLRSTWTMLTTRFPAPEGRELTRAEAPALFARLDDMRTRMQGPRFHHVQLTDEMNAAVVQHPRFGLLGGHRNYLILGLPLLQVLSPEEAMAVVAHEYGHLAGQHGRFGAFIYRLRNAWGQMQDMASGWTDAGSRLVAKLFHWYAPFFNAYTFVLARQNEYEADRSSAELVGPGPAANALTRFNIASRFQQAEFWPGVHRSIRTEPVPPVACSQLFASAWRERLLPEQQREFLTQALDRVTDHSDTHPALADRLRALGVDPAQVAPPAPAGETAADAWFGSNLLALQAALDTEWSQAVAPQWQERHAYLQGQLARLAELRALAERSEEHEWELIRVTEEMEPETDLLPLLEALLARNPKHASALYTRGRVRLDRGEETGIADLEKVMQLDPEATLPACNLIYGFLAERDEARAETYRQRWIARNDFEERLRAELDTFDPKTAKLAASDLGAEAHAGFLAVLRDHPKGIKRAWLLRRLIDTDPEARAYVLAIETTMWTGESGAQKIVETLAAIPLPEAVHIVPLSLSAFAKTRKQIKKLKLEPLYP
jgi:Zn-dependent protease with chaperone function